MIKKADIALFFVILISGLLISYFTFTGNNPGDKVTVTVDGSLYGTYSLSEDLSLIHISSLTPWAS